MADKVYHVTAVRCSQPKTSRKETKITQKTKTIKDDHKVRYHEEDPSELQAAKARRPRRHTTGGSNKDAIEKAKQMIADDPSIDTKKHANNLGTLDRKQLVSMLKTRYGDDIEKYRSLKKHETLEVDHRNLVENGLPKRQTSHKTLSYKTSSGGDGGSTSGSVRRNSLSSQESSQTSQESIPYSASPPKYDSHSAKAMQAAALQQYAQRNRKVSNGSSIQSGYSSYSEDPHNVTQVITQRTTVVTKQQQQPHLQHQQLQQQQTLHQNEVQQQPLREEQLRKFDELQQREQEVLHTERQKQLQYSQVEQQQTLDQDRVLFLQYKDEIKRVNMPNSITSLDTLKALFVTSFPGKLSMVRIDERGLIYIKDKEADIFYELEDLRDIQPRSHVQIRERLSYDSLASSQSDMNSHDNRYNHSSTTYHYATMPHHGRRPNQQQQYAESLQDFPTSRPRSGSGSSLRSDSVLTRPQRNAEPPAEKTTYVNSGFLSPRNSRKETRIEKTEKTRYEIKPIRKESEKKGQTDGQQYVEPPVLKSRKQSEKEKQKKGPSVEEQLADLTKLLHTAIHSDEEDSGFSEQVRAPGKLDPHVIDNLNALSADNYSKSPTKSRAYAPTALLQSKKREVEGPSDESYFKFDSHTYSKAVDIPGMSREDSLEETEKGYMHDGPDQYMKSPKKVYDFDSDDGPNQYIKSPKKVYDFDSDREYESGLADTLLKSLQSPTSSTSSRASTSVRISSSGVSSSGSYVTSPPPAPARKPSSKIAVQTIKPSMSPTKRQEQHTWSSTTTTTKQGQFKMDRMIGIASSAASLRNSILTLRSQLDELRLLQTNQSRNFKIFMTQSLNDFNSLANTVSQNIRKSQGNGHSIRDRRSRVQEDYDGYVKRQQNASDHLSQLEDDTERLRRDVVQRKRVLEAHHVTKLNSDLESLGKILAELKSRFSGLHDMLKIVMAGELEIIVSEERFLKDEPSNLDNLYARCKHLSGTLFTLQRLANVQQMARSNDQQDINQNRVQVKVNQRGPASSSDEVPHQRTSTSSSSRSVRFTSDGRSGFL